MNVTKTPKGIQRTLYIKHIVHIQNGTIWRGKEADPFIIKNVIRETEEMLADESVEDYNGIDLHDHHVALNILMNIGDKWQINAEIYWHFCNLLPPISTPNGFLMSEALKGDIHSNYFKENGKYYHQYVLIAYRKR